MSVMPSRLVSTVTSAAPHPGAGLFEGAGIEVVDPQVDGNVEVLLRQTTPGDCSFGDGLLHLGQQVAVEDQLGAGGDPPRQVFRDLTAQQQGGDLG